MSSRSVQIIGPDTGGFRTSVTVEELVGLLGVVDMEQTAVSLGIYFEVGHYEPAILDTQALEVLLRTPVVTVLRTVMLATSVTAGGNTLFEVFQAPTVVADGAVLTPIQMNQLSSGVSATEVFHTPTLSADGTNIFRTFLPGSTGLNPLGDSTSPFQRLITLPDTDYLIRMRNVSGSASDMSINLNTVEIPPVPS